MESQREPLTNCFIGIAVATLTFLVLIATSARASETPLFTGNFESGGLTEWSEVQAIPGRITVVKDVVAQGAYAGRFEVKEGDKEPKTGSQRAEVISGLEFNKSDVRYFHIHARVDSWDFNHWGIIWQIHDESSGSPPLSLQLVMSKSTPMLWLGPGDASAEYWKAPLPELGKWFEVVIKVEFGSAGSLRVWFSNELQTMLNGKTTYSGVNTLGEAPSYDKLGIYRSSSSEGTAVVRHDDYRVTKSFTSDAPLFESSFGSKGSGNGQFSYPTGVVNDSQGNAWIVDSGNNRIEKLKFNGEYLSQFGSGGTGNGQFSLPGDIAIDAAGNFWVTDSGNNRVEKFNSSGAYLTKFGSGGTGNGQFSLPGGIAIDAAGNLWVADIGNNRIQKFNSEGKYLAKFGTSGTGNGQFQLPADVAVDSAGNIWVADGGNNRIQKFNSNGEYLSQFGSYGSGEGQLKSPVGIAVDAQGTIWVADSSNNRIQRFNSKGQYVSQFGIKGSGAGQFDSPHGISVDPQGDLWVTDTNNHRVQKWGFP